MKKVTISLFSALLLIVLAACGNNNDNNVPNNNGNNENNNNEEVANNDSNEDEGEMSVEELFEKTVEAQQDLESISFTMDSDSVVDMDGEEIDTNQEIETDLVYEPLMMKQTITQSIPEEGEQEIESYLSEDGFYMFEPTEDQWYELPSEMAESLGAMNEQAQDPALQMEQLEHLKDHFELEEDDDQYILTFSSDDSEELKEIVDNQLEALMPEELQGMGLDLDDVEVNNMSYEMTIDKETFLTNTLESETDMAMTVEDSEMTIQQSMSIEYTEYDSVEDIEIPEEVLEEAEELEM